MADEIRVVRGTPTDEELAAIVGVLLLRPRKPGPDERPSRWALSTRPGSAPRSWANRR